MGAPRKLPDTAELVKLRGEGWSVRAIAEKYSVVPTTVWTALQKARVWPVVEIDPREHLSPALFEAVGPEAAERWRRERVCLCGCGEPVTQRTQWVKRCPPGSYNFFVDAHLHRVDAMRHIRAVPDTEKRAKVRAQLNHERSVDPGIILDLMEEYLSEHEMPLVAFAQKAGVSVTNLSQIRHRPGRRMHVTTAVRVMRAMGEPIPEHLEKRYKRLKRKGTTAA